VISIRVPFKAKKDVSSLAIVTLSSKILIIPFIVYFTDYAGLNGGYVRVMNLKGSEGNQS